MFHILEHFSHNSDKCFMWCPTGIYPRSTSFVNIFNKVILMTNITMHGDIRNFLEVREVNYYCSIHLH